MVLSHDHLPFIHLIFSQNQAVRARASGTDRVKSAVDVSSSALYRLTIRIRSDDTIHPNTNTLFGPPEAKTKRIFGTSLKWIYSAPLALHLTVDQLNSTAHSVTC